MVKITTTRVIIYPTDRHIQLFCSLMKIMSMRKTKIALKEIEDS